MDRHDAFKNTLNALVAGLTSESIATYDDLAGSPAIQKAVQSVKDGELDMFWAELSYPLEQMVDGLLMATIPQSADAQFLFKESQFVESHFKEIIKQVEGWPLSADKSRTIMNRLLKYLLTGEQIVFNYEQEITYHLPKRVFTEHAIIVQFFDGIKSLRYGKAHPFIEAIAAVYKSAKPVNDVKD